MVFAIAVWAAPSSCNNGHVANVTLSCSDEIRLYQCCRDGQPGPTGQKGKKDTQDVKVVKA